MVGFAKACFVAWVWKLLEVIWDALGACLTTLATANGRRNMKAMVLGRCRTEFVLGETD